MKQTFLSAALLSGVLLSPVSAQEEESMMERGLSLFLEGLLQEVEPTLRDLEGMAREMEPALRSFADQMGPALRGLMEEVEDWSAYHPPEILENGDIILRKKTPEERAAKPEAAPIDI